MNQIAEAFSMRQLMHWVSKGCRTWGFAVEVKGSNTQGYLDKYFNGGYPEKAPFRYESLPDPQFGFFTLRYNPYTYSDVRGLEDDTLNFWEAYWTFPARRHDIVDGKPSGPPKIVWVQPFSVCDNPLVMFGGREIWGADVIQAKITCVGDMVMNNLHLDVAVNGFETFSPRAEGQLLACMHINMNGAVRLNDGEVKSNCDSLVRFAQNISGADGSGTAVEPMTFIPPGGESGVCEQNFVKQIRDCEDWNHAIYRAIVATQTDRTDHEVLIYSGERIQLDLMWSATVAGLYTELFGIDEPPGPAEPPPDHADKDDGNAANWNLKRSAMTVQLAYSFDSDVMFEVKETPYVYGAPGEAARRRASALKS